MVDELQIGPHKVRVEGDTVLVRWIGTPGYEDTRTIHKQFDRALADHGRLFVINDMRHSGIPSTPTRKWIAEWARENTITSVVNFGASLPIRVLQTMIFRALELVGNGPTVETIHCGNEAEAFAWIEARRSNLQAK